ncbi:SLC19 family protein [Sphingobium sp. PNB]|uniref:SLC19 family protein n=1 Tax=Sphingobium sp. PNB TaxID=863934 RepID=UPI001CA41A14|nr:SLC19 family protein [Sphingobium sp. PNB]MCB4859524.1 SLC19 family protein [Sphingobium sp. PNB]
MFTADCGPPLPIKVGAADGHYRLPTLLSMRLPKLEQNGLARSWDKRIRLWGLECCGFRQVVAYVDLKGWVHICSSNVLSGLHLMADKRAAKIVGPALKVAGVVVLCLVSGVIGGALTRNFGTSSYTLSYADFVSVMLTAVSLLMTVLAIFLAVVGFLGWTTIEQKVHGKTEDFLAKGFEKGGRLDRVVVDMIERKTEEIMFRGVQPVGEDDLNGSEEDKGENGGVA